MKRPPGITILGLLCIFAGGALFSPRDRLLLSFGIIHRGIAAFFGGKQYDER